MVDQSAAGSAAGTRVINLALQGGGAHGAFAWGVIDRLLEDGRLTFEGISATSAGAMNATVTAYGLMEGGREGAREALRVFWRKISEAGSQSPLQPSWLDRLSGSHSLESSPAYLAFDILSRVLSPYQFNPLNVNPLRDVLTQVVDFDKLRKQGVVQLYLCATTVSTGKIRVFSGEEITVEAVLASGCLPFLFQAIEIGGEHYWDGGYMGNPAIFPLIYNTKSSDVLIVHINPINRPELPTTARDILNRINEISFNSSLMREMRAISFVTKLIEAGKITDPSMRHMFIHSVEAEEVMSRLSVSSKLNPDWDFLTYLFDVGRKRGDKWLRESFDKVGYESTVDIYEKFL